MSPLEEQALLDRCRSGKGEAWDEFFDAFYGPTHRFVSQLLPDGSLQDLEDVCQEAFLAAIRALPSFGGRSRIQTWLCRIAANKARDHRDHRSAAKRGGGRSTLSLDASGTTGHDPREVPDPSRRPDQHLASEEAMLEVRQALDRLDEPCRDILELRYFADLAYDAIGEALNLNTKTVSSRLSRCLDRLGHLLQAGPSPEEPGASSV